MGFLWKNGDLRVYRIFCIMELSKYNKKDLYGGVFIADDLINQEINKKRTLCFKPRQALILEYEDGVPVKKGQSLLFPQSQNT
ncbi:MAG: hypothetical protein WC180_04385 [Candidatus Paceibacterota bacterium]|jgi:hypothetical protein